MGFQNRDDFWSDGEGSFFDVKERTGKRVQRGVEEETAGGGRLFVQEWREKMEGKSGGFGEGCGGNGVCERPGGEGEVRGLEGDVKKSCELQVKNIPLIKALFSEVNPIPVQKAMKLMGM